MTNLFEFPKHAVIVGAAKNDFTLSLEKIHPIIKRTTIDTGADPREKLEPITILKEVVKCQVSDAVLALTPYFWISTGQSTPSLPASLAAARFSLVIDNEIYILDGSVKNHLTDFEGNLPDTAKLSFAKPKKGACLGNLMANGATVPGSTFGYFLLNESCVSIEVRDITSGYGKIELEAGLVAALYTTRAGKKGV